MLNGCGGDAPAAQTPAIQPPQATFVGSVACGACHAAQLQQWQGSHHQLAMQPALPATVLGRFDDRAISDFGRRSRLSRRGDEFWIETANAGGKTESFRVEYTLGVYPLQQYLLALPGGRLQAFTMAWDSRPVREGGGRWFNLQSEGPAPPGDPLHWTGPNFNWNSRCAECHTTGLHRNFDAATTTYASTWSEADVGCESCHGPGSVHVSWAASHAGAASGAVGKAGDDGLLGGQLGPATQWIRNQGEATAHAVSSESLLLPTRLTGAHSPDSAAASGRQLDACAGCHSRRQRLESAEALQAIAHYSDAYALALPTPPMYHADGQIRQEDFELGSFLQSKMHARGVVCSNCHEPHSLQLRATGNALCAQCHDPQVFDAPAHHHHAAKTAGAQCIGCHMPTTTYMVVHARHDHSLRIPRPDLSQRFGTPNACNVCHGRQTPAWAAQQVQAWRRAAGRESPTHFSERLASEDPAAWRELAADGSVPGIARAAALNRMAQQPDNESLMRALAALKDSDPLVRRAAVSFFDLLEPERRASYLAALIHDPAKSVRMEVARVLGPASGGDMTAEARAALDTLFVEYVAALTANRDMPGDALALGTYYADRGQAGEAEQAYRSALRIDPHFTPAALNLADLYHQLDREKEAHVELESALQRSPQSAELHHALGLQRVRAHEPAQALLHLKRAHELSPDDATYGFVYAVALADGGELRHAITVLQRLRAQHPGDPRVTQALAEYQTRASVPPAR